MCPGIRPATGWIAYFTSTPRVLEELGELADPVLGLRHGQAVARDDDHRARVRELDRRVVDAELALGAAAGRRRAGRAVAAAEPADHDVQDGAVHGVGHELGQDRAGGTHEGAADDQDRVAEHEAGHRDGHARERVEQRDDDRHVGAADRERHRDAEDQRGDEDDPHHREADVAGPQEQRAGDRDQGERRGDELAAGDHDRPGRRDLEAHQLARRDQRAGERDRADHDVEHGRDVDLVRPGTTFARRRTSGTRRWR